MLGAHLSAQFSSSRKHNRYINCCAIFYTLTVLGFLFTFVLEISLACRINLGKIKSRRIAIRKHDVSFTVHAVITSSRVAPCSSIANRIYSTGSSRDRYNAPPNYANVVQRSTFNTKASKRQRNHRALRTNSKKRGMQKIPSRASSFTRST